MDQLFNYLQDQINAVANNPGISPDIKVPMVAALIDQYQKFYFSLTLL